MFLIYVLMTINFPLWTAFAMSHRFSWVVFLFLLNSRNFDFLPYFFYDPVIIEQCGIQPPIV
jgi:hypothetical protein